ncbi:MAG: AMP-binding protein, partial [Anaerovoracaceae bacterium]
MIRIGELKKVFSPVRHENLRELLRYSAREFADDDAFIVKTKKGKEVSYEHISFAAFYERVNQLGTALLLRGMEGKRIAIIGKNREEWVESYFAVLGGLGICVPLDKGLPYEELESSLARSYADVLIFDPAHKEQVETLKAAGTTDSAKVNEALWN